MTSLTIKWIALITMAFDHIGAVFFPNILWIRFVGRISFPIFAFLLVQGYIHTSSKGKYLFRLGLFALISEIPYDLCLYGKLFDYRNQNIFFELLLGFVALIFMEQTAKKRNPLYFFGVLTAMAIALFIGASYSLYGISIILAFYLLRKFKGADALALIVLTYGFYGVSNFQIEFFSRSYSILQLNSVQMYAIFASVPIVFYNSLQGKKKIKWIFYFFYPVHLIILWAVKMLLTQGKLTIPWI